MEDCDVNRATLLTGLFLGAAVAAPASALPIPDGWHKSKDDGVAAARKSRRPVLVVTAWKDKV
jgi:hypothetical protein